MASDFTTQRANRDALRSGTGDRLRGREHALEEAFFAKRERELLEALRQKIERERELKDLLEQCGIDDSATAEALAGCGIRASTLPALILTPLLAVAWADGEMEDYEREALVKRALQHRIVPDTEAWDLLQSWLSNKPPDALFEAWMAYAKELAETMAAGERSAFAREILGMASGIAEESRRHRRFDLERCVDELRVLDRIERVFGEMTQG